MSTVAIHVVAGVIYDAQQRILLALRPRHLHQGGLWEFPGGKVEVGENPEQALRRELFEELDIYVTQARPLIRIQHHYPDKNILLDVWQVTAWQGVARGKEGQTLAWCDRAELRAKPLPAANYPIVKAIQLPVFYLITPEPEKPKDKHFLHQLERRLDSGTIQLVQLRAKRFPDNALCECAERVMKICENYGARLLVNASAEVAQAVGTNGLHLNSQRLHDIQQRPLAKNLLVAASCHTASDIVQADKIECDFMVLSPVRRTQSHPDAVPLGWLRFFELTELARCPVFALGGMQPDELETVWSHGGQGIAAIRALWDSETAQKGVKK